MIGAAWSKGRTILSGYPAGSCYFKRSGCRKERQISIDAFRHNIRLLFHGCPEEDVEVEVVEVVDTVRGAWWLWKGHQNESRVGSTGRRQGGEDGEETGKGENEGERGNAAKERRRGKWRRRRGRRYSTSVSASLTLQRRSPQGFTSRQPSTSLGGVAPLACWCSQL